MKTFEDIQREMVNKMYKSPEGWPPTLSMIKLCDQAAREYAKMWIDKAAEMHLQGCRIYAADIRELKEEIDAQ